VLLLHRHHVSGLSCLIRGWCEDHERAFPPPFCVMESHRVDCLLTQCVLRGRRRPR
jgi:hypothetical protein